MTEDKLVQAVLEGGPHDGQVLRVLLERPRIIAFPGDGGGYVRQAGDELPLVYTWRDVETPPAAMPGLLSRSRSCLVALVAGVVLWLLVALGAWKLLELVLPQ